MHSVVGIGPLPLVTISTMKLSGFRRKQEPGLQLRLCPAEEPMVEVLQFTELLFVAEKDCPLILMKAPVKSWWWDFFVFFTL